MSAAGWNARGRGGPARGGGDSRLEAGTAGRARAMPHFTVVPVDGPRRGDYDNLEGLSWVDYGERAEREDSDGEGAPGRDLDWGRAGWSGGRLHGTRAAGLRANRSVRDRTSLAPARAQTDESSRSRTPEPGHLPPATSPQLLPRRAAGGGCRRGRLGRPASRLPHSGWCRTRDPGPGPGSTEACTAASSLSVTRPHPLENYPFFPCDSPPLSCPLPIPASLHSGPIGSEGVLLEGPLWALVWICRSSGHLGSSHTGPSLSRHCT